RSVRDPGEPAAEHAIEREHRTREADECGMQRRRADDGLDLLADLDAARMIRDQLLAEHQVEQRGAQPRPIVETAGEQDQTIELARRLLARRVARVQRPRDHAREQAYLVGIALGGFGYAAQHLEPALVEHEGIVTREAL